MYIRMYVCVCIYYDLLSTHTFVNEKMVIKDCNFILAKVLTSFVVSWIGPLTSVPIQLDSRFVRSAWLFNIYL